MRHVAGALAVFLIAGFLNAQKDHGIPPSDLAKKCGSQIAWQPKVTDSKDGRETTLEAALMRAKEMKRPVFWYLATTRGSPMDRKPVIDMYMRAGPFSMPDVVSMINRRFIPVAVLPTKEQAKEHHLAPLEFIEPGFIVLKPDRTEIGRVDRITTFQENWFVEVLNKILEGQGELGRPSDASAKASDPLDQAEQLLQDGLYQRAYEALAKVPPESQLIKSNYLRLQLWARRADFHGSVTDPIKDLVQVDHPDGQVEIAMIHLRSENWAAAEKVLAQVTRGNRLDEARYLRGVALHRLNRQPEAYELWKQLADSAQESPWGWKAAAESERYGPFGRGFEEYGHLSKDAIPETMKGIAGTQRGRDLKDVDWLVKRSVRYLLERQNPDGSFDDSNYDFGGRDSLPDVYAAVTALSALALLEWSTVEPERNKAAITRAAAYLSDESHIATTNTQERVWAHAYRILFFARLASSGGPLAEQALMKLKDVTKRLQDLQAQNGQFAHEYPNPFASATALHALKVAEKAGAQTPAASYQRGAAAVKGTRGSDGTFSYGFGGKGGDRDVDFAGGRQPTCELALFLCGASSQAGLESAIKTSIEHHPALEASRKYDDHVPQNHRIGGFFFWYDVFGRCLAIDALDDVAKKRALFDRERKAIADIAEIDGRFVDSHELGKPYGTAMGLLSLKLCAPAGP